MGVFLVLGPHMGPALFGFPAKIRRKGPRWIWVTLVSAHGDSPMTGVDDARSPAPTAPKPSRKGRGLKREWTATPPDARPVKTPEQDDG
jgi:hypothetical protein